MTVIGLTYSIFRGWPVEAITLFHSHPSGSIFFRSEVAREIGTWTNWWFQKPTSMLVRPVLITGQQCCQRVWRQFIGRTLERLRLVPRHDIIG